MIKKLYYLLPLLIFHIHLGHSQTLYVSPSGNDQNSGTVDQPLQSLKKVSQILRKQLEVTEVILSKGRYEGGITIFDNNSKKRLIIRSAENERVIIDGSKALKDTPSQKVSANVFKINHRPQAVWDSEKRFRYALVADEATVLTKEGSYCIQGDSFIIHVQEGRHPYLRFSQYTAGFRVNRSNVTFDGLEFLNFLAGTWSSGIMVSAKDIHIMNCKVNNAQCGFFIYGPKNNGIRPKISNCEIRDVKCGIYTMAQDSLIENNRIFKSRDSFMIYSHWQDDTGIQCYYPAKHGKITGNLVKGFKNGIYIKCRGIFDIRHNTLIDVEKAFRNKWKKGNILSHNIAYDIKTPIAAGHNINPGSIFENNLFYKAKILELFHTGLQKAESYGFMNYVADPLFINPLNNDYRVSPKSVANLMKTGKRAMGAFNAVSSTFKDKVPPIFEIEPMSPAVKLGQQGKYYYLPDPWLKLPDKFVKNIEKNNKSNLYAISSNKVKIRTHAKDALGKVVSLQIRLNQQKWQKAIPFRNPLTVQLENINQKQQLDIRVSDDNNNWSQSKSIYLNIYKEKPKLSDKPTFFSNPHGIIVSFKSNIPAFAKLIVKNNNRKTIYQKALREEHSWDAMSGGDWVERWRKLNVSHHIFIPQKMVGNSFTIKLTNALQEEFEVFSGILPKNGDYNKIYVSPDGKESNNGNIDQPYAKIQSAVDRALPGDTIIIKPGVYTQEVRFDRGGLPGHPITLQAEKEGSVIIDGLKKSYRLIQLNHADHITIKHLELRWFRRAGIYAVDSKFLNVSHCKIWNDQLNASHLRMGDGIFLHRSPSSQLTHNLLLGIDAGMVLLQSDHALVKNNTSIRTDLGGVILYHSTHNTTVINNSFCFNGNDQMYIVTFNESELQSFISDHNNFATNLRQSNNPNKDSVEGPKFARGSKAIICCNYKRYHSMKDWRAAHGKDKNSIFAKPLYANYQTHNFQLKKNSPNISAGKSGEHIGAFGPIK